MSETKKDGAGARRLASTRQSAKTGERGAPAVTRKSSSADHPATAGRSPGASSRRSSRGDRPPAAPEARPRRAYGASVSAAGISAADLPGRRPASGERGSRPPPRSALGRARAAVAASALDYPLVAIVATLLALCLVMVFSASFWQAQKFFSLPPAYFFTRQVIWAAVGVAALVVAYLIPYRWWSRLAIPLMMATLVLLLATLIFGDYRYGARRTLFGGSIQPSEIAKLTVAIYVAAWVTSKRRHLREVQGGLFPFAVLMGMVAGLIVLEPSISVTIIILVIGTAIFFVGGGDAKQLALSALIGALVLGVFIWQSPHGGQRVQDWWAMIANPGQVNEHAAQIMAMLRQGHGIGTNPENWLPKLGVPLLWSDYIFANVGADLGFPGAVATVALFAGLGYRGLAIALATTDRFACLTAIGVVTWIMTQAVIHMCASLALIPATGVPLPFVSYGGSALVSCMAGVGILLSIGRSSQRREASARHSFDYAQDVAQDGSHGR